MMEKERMKRARAMARFRTLDAAVEAGALEPFQDLSASEAVILGLLNQDVTTFIGVFGHGSTDLGEVMRIYEEAGALKTYQVHSEIEASHAAAALRWQYGITPAVFTSIGPGALQAMAASLVSLSNGLGVYYLFGDETTQSEGPNMQQIPRREQELFLKLTSTMGPSYTLHTPQAVFTALKRGSAAVHRKQGEKPFYLLLPMNVQPAVTPGMNLLEFPRRCGVPALIGTEDSSFKEAVKLIRSSSRILIKTGGGARSVAPETLKQLIDLTGAVYVHGPHVPGLFPASDPRNMTVGGSKGSICGNYAMEEAELLLVAGARGVCQWDSSGTAFKKVRRIININSDPEDLSQYNRTLTLPGDASAVLKRLVEELSLNARTEEHLARCRPWQEECAAKRREWEAFKTLRFEAPLMEDSKFRRPLMGQPAALKIAVDFAERMGAVKFFDAGDVQANGFQIVVDDKPKRTYTDTGASYMGFAVCALLASAMVESPEYPMAFTGDGSFLMNPQILSDAVEHKLRGMILLFDNRRMGAISSLQEAQYEKDYRTDDSVTVDYAHLAQSFQGVKGFSCRGTHESLAELLPLAYAWDGLSLIHIPVYYGEDPLGGLGAFGSWNVGNWCIRVQPEKHKIGL